MKNKTTSDKLIPVPLTRAEVGEYVSTLAELTASDNPMPKGVGGKTPRQVVDWWKAHRADYVRRKLANAERHGSDGMTKADHREMLGVHDCAVGTIERLLPLVEGPARPAASQPAMKVELSLSTEQLDTLLVTIESTLDADSGFKSKRGLDLLKQARAGHPCPWSYDIEMLAPTYEELLRHWGNRKGGRAMQSDGLQLRYGERLVAEQAAKAASA